MDYSLSFKANLSKDRLDADAAAYINAVVAAGATATSTQRRAINDFYKTGKSQGWYGQLKRLYLPIWGVAAPNAIDTISLLSGTFSGGITHSSGYVSTDATTGYFSFDLAPDSLGLTTSSGSIYCLVTSTAEIGGAAHLCGVQDSSNNSRVAMTGGGPGIRAIRVFSAVGVSYAETDGRSVLVASKTTTTTNSAYKRTSSGFVTTVNEAASGTAVVGTTQPLVVMASNNNGAVGIFSPTAFQFGAYGMGLGLTAAQAESLTLALKALWETATGLTLP
jgi:hypothetical protein